MSAYFDRGSYNVPFTAVNEIHSKTEDKEACEYHLEHKGE